MDNPREIIRMEKIRKSYDNGFLANEDIDFALYEGEIHAIAGENGAGKSTLMKVLNGFERPDSGKIILDGQPVRLRSPSDALSRGIGMVYQHFMLVDELTVMENIFLGTELSKFGWLRKKEMLNQLKNFCEKYQFGVDINLPCKVLSVGQKQKVEILKVLMKAAKVLVFDEPTAVLTAIESDELFSQLRLLREAGHTIVIITHKLDEIKRLCDRVTILRKGKSIGTYDVKDISTEEISRLMVGFDVNLHGAERERSFGKTILNVDRLSVKSPSGKTLVADVSLSMRQKEIVCLTGIEGNGQENVISALVGEDNDYSGLMTIDNVDIRGKTIGAIRDLGVGYIPSDRMTIGSDTQGSILDNLIPLEISDMPKKQLGLINRKRMVKESNRRVELYRIATDTIHREMNLLSGGNMQKVVLARELDRQPKLLIACHPTRGIDVGTIEFIYERLRELRDEGSSILLLSTDWNEILALADRLLVFYDGKVVADFSAPFRLDEHELGKYMLGLKTMNKDKKDA